MPSFNLPTPCLLLDATTMRANIASMNAAVRGRGAELRPHLKTAKSVEVARAMTDGWSGAVTVSTLREAEAFFAAGCRDILYAVGVAPGKLEQAQGLTARGANLTLITDNVPAAEAIARSLQGAELLRHSTPEVIDVFMKTRLGGTVNCWGTMFGTLGPGVRQAQADIIVERARVTR